MAEGQGSSRCSLAFGHGLNEDAARTSHRNFLRSGAVPLRIRTDTALFFSPAYANGANDNFKGVATLFGSGTTNFRRALIWATVTTFLGSLTGHGHMPQLLSGPAVGNLCRGNATDFTLCLPE